MTVGEFLKWDSGDEVRYELADDELRAMAVDRLPLKAALRAEWPTASALDLAMLVSEPTGRAALISSDSNGRVVMNLTRRDLAAAGVLALGATTLIVPAMAAGDDEETVKQ